MSEEALIRRGHCHVLGDNIPLDEGIMPFSFAINRITDPVQLIPHLFCGVDPTLAEKIKEGDFILAGKNFASGKAHMQGFIAMASLGLSVLCETMPYKAHRGAIAKGVAILTGCVNLSSFAQDGDDIEVNFLDGIIQNHTQSTRMQAPALSPILSKLVRVGGLQSALKLHIELHPEMKLPRLESQA